MANFEIIWADDFQKQLENLGAKFDEIAPKMIDEAAPILEESMKRKLLRHKDTGELINSIKAKKAKPVKGGGYYGYVTATGVAKGKADILRKVTAIIRKCLLWNLEPQNNHQLRFYSLL